MPWLPNKNVGSFKNNRSTIFWIASVSVIPIFFLLYCSYLVLCTDSAFITMEGYMILLNALAINDPASSYLETAHSWGPLYPYLIHFIGSLFNIAYETAGLLISVSASSIVLLLLPFLSRYIFGTYFPGLVTQAGLALLHMYFDFAIRLEVHHIGFFLLGCSLFAGIYFIRNPSIKIGLLVGIITAGGVLGRVLTIVCFIALLTVIVVNRFSQPRETNLKTIHGWSVLLGGLLVLVPYFLTNLVYKGSLFPPDRWLHLSQNVLNVAHTHYPDLTFPYTYAEWFEAEHLNHTLFTFLQSYPLLTIVSIFVNIKLFFKQLFIPTQMADFFIYVGFFGGVYLTGTIFWDIFKKNLLDYLLLERIFLSVIFCGIWFIPLLGIIQKEMHQFLPMGIFYPVIGIGLLLKRNEYLNNKSFKGLILLVLIVFPFLGLINLNFFLKESSTTFFDFHAHELKLQSNSKRPWTFFTITKKEIPTQRENFNPLNFKLRKAIKQAIAKDQGVKIDPSFPFNQQVKSSSDNQIVIASHFYLSSVYEMGFTPILLRPPSYYRSLHENLCYKQLPEGYSVFSKSFSYPPGKPIENHLPPDYILVHNVIQRQFTEGTKEKKHSNTLFPPFINTISYFDENLELLYRGETSFFLDTTISDKSKVSLYKTPEYVKCK